MILARRSFLAGLGASLIAAPAIVRASSLMKVKPLRIAESLRVSLRAQVEYGTSYPIDVGMRLVMDGKEYVITHVTDSKTSLDYTNFCMEPIA
jgi:hypothetical protein